LYSKLGLNAEVFLSKESLLPVDDAPRPKPIARGHNNVLIYRHTGVLLCVSIIKCSERKREVRYKNKKKTNRNKEKEKDKREKNVK
jgi:hypothetical protein